MRPVGFAIVPGVIVEVAGFAAGKDELGTLVVPFGLLEAISAGIQSWLSNGAVSLLLSWFRNMQRRSIFLRQGQRC